MKSILVVEDNYELLTYLRELLTDERYVVHLASNGAKAIKLFEKVDPDLVLLDLTLPDINGETVKQELKSINKHVPIIILTADADPTTVVRNLREGADDYINKPFKSNELLARIAARLRRSDSKLLSIDNLTIDTEKMEVRRGKDYIDLTPTEYELLTYLISNKEKVLTREMILSRVWSQDNSIQTRVVDVYIGYLRKKLGDPQLINSKRGYGYFAREPKRD